MTRITRRRFVREAAFAACVSCHFPTSSFAQILAKTQQPALPDRADIKKLASKISGCVILPNSSDYESARLVGNRAYDLHPALIVRCATPSDIARALDFGQSHTLPIAVRCGAHSAGGYGTCDGGVVIDLSAMKRVEVDADKRLARAEAGALVGNVDQATQRFGLAVPMGTCPTVGIGGLTLGGGEGRLMPKYGATCDNVQSARVMTVDGREIEASQSSNSDLFWAIRGGGGNFGVVTEFKYRLYPVTTLLEGALVYPPGHVAELLQAYLKFTETAPDEMSVAAVLLPSEQGPRLMISVSFFGQDNVGNELLRPLRAPLKPQADAVEVRSYLEAQSSTPFGGPTAYFETDVFIPDLRDAAIAAITTAVKDAPRRFMILIGYLHGAVSRVRSGDTAFPLRQRGHGVVISGNWSSPEEKTTAMRWVTALRAALEPFANGAYVNGLIDPSGELVRAAYGPNYARLVEIKKKYDPANVLRLNPNIRPG